VDEIIRDAMRARASDIHIEPQETELLVRYRVDGIISTRKRMDLELLTPISSRIKVMAGLDITERRMPQDGRMRATGFGGDVQLRISTAPMVGGEKIVLRALNAKINELKLENLGLSPENMTRYKPMIHLPHGLMLHCGPTGSGKTTSLYTALNHIRGDDRNIQTIEDPVEARMLGLNQAQVQTDIGLTFAVLLRSYLRQDCDVILVGEIRDNETANLAVQASLTGHLVLGTLHCNSAVGAVSRLTEMDVAPFFLGSGLSGVVYQRLVRKLCKECKELYSPPARVARALGIDQGERIYRAVGCRACGHTGYKGRILLQEVLRASDDVRQAIFDHVPTSELTKLARDDGMIPIFQDGLVKAREGLTSVEEVARVVKGVHLGK
jgi:type II secretory ATPase GspE/PulE/Tfp pilus assembly ATPase PilB-like protein